MLRSLALAAVALSLWGCAGPGASSRDPEVLRGLPPRHDPPLDLGDDDDLGRARAAYDALTLDDASRPARRRELAQAYASGMDKLDRETAFHRLEEALGLWDARELDAADRPVADLDVLVPQAEVLYKRASTSGEDLPAITAIAVLRAAHPERAAELDRSYKDIVAYTDDLAAAESGPGAEGSRAIHALESTTRAFPSRWAADRLVELYLARQDAIQRALSSKSKKEVLAPHRDPGVMRPVWNLVRIQARTRRLAEAVPLTDKLAGQFGDDADLRQRLAVALKGEDGRAWLALMARFVPSDLGGDGDAGAALILCEEGATRLPRAIEPRKCAGEIARLTDHPGLALRWIREARALDPNDRDVAEIFARLQIVRLGDQMQAERLEAGRETLRETEAFYADVDKRLRGKPLETPLSQVLLTYARGLYTQGEIDEATRVLERVRKIADTPDATEELANIALKTGHYGDALRGFELAAAAPRQTPIETVFDGNRLKRLAGEAAFYAGDRVKADQLWNQALAGWKDAMGASLPDRAMAQAYTEVGRLQYALGDKDKAMTAFGAAIDAEPEQAGTYGDVIAFLVARGHYPEALDSYHRAMGRPEVTEYLRAYTSIWMLDLAHLRGQQPDGQATGFLGGVNGDKWYHQLARFKLGKLSFAELRSKADTRGKRAEAYFYQAMARYAAGDRAGAEKLLHEVEATHMLGFFEYDMARLYLSGQPSAVRR